MYQSPLLAIAGAVAPGEQLLIDAAGVPFHYGDPLAEQRRLADTPSLIDRSQRAVVAVSGPDAPAFLNNLLSQKLDDAAAGFAASALDLDAQGHILHHVDVAFDGETFYLDMPRAQRESLVDYLNRMVFWSNVTVADADLAVLTALSPAPGAEVPRAVLTREQAWSDGLTRTDALVPRAEIAAAAEEFQRAGGRLAGLMAYTATRVRAGEPELGADLDGKSIPHEAPRLINRGARLGAVHLDKGCYRGQETVARVENLGRSPRLLVMLQLDGSSPAEPATGAQITAGGRAVGRLGTVVHDADYGPIALGLVKRSALSAPLDIDGTAASVDADFLRAVEAETAESGAGRRAVSRLRNPSSPAGGEFL